VLISLKAPVFINTGVFLHKFTLDYFSLLHFLNFCIKYYKQQKDIRRSGVAVPLNSFGTKAHRHCKSAEGALCRFIGRLLLYRTRGHIKPPFAYYFFELT